MYRKINALAIIIGLVAIFAFTIIDKFPAQIQQLLCNPSPGSWRMLDSENWQISQATINAQIIWQKTDTGDNPADLDGVVYNGLATTNGTVAYIRENIQKAQFPCNNSQTELIAYDSNTGEKIWRRELFSGTARPYPLSDGFLLIDNGAAVKLSIKDGVEQWRLRYDELPLRSIRQVYESGDYLDIVSHIGIHQLNKLDGKLLKTINNDNLLAFYGDYMVKVTNRNHLHLMNLDSISAHEVTDYLSHSHQLDQGAYPDWPVIQRQGNYLIISFRDQEVEVYRIDTGKQLWLKASSITGISRLMDNTIIIYHSNQLSLYDLETGAENGVVTLKRVEESLPYTDYPNVTMTTAENIVVLNFLDLHELIAIKMG
jgi:putative pyrroloquinoline-quinone binding quinoprotein